MDLAKVASIPSRFNKMLLPPPGKKSLFLPIRPFNFNVPYHRSIQCNSSNNQISNNCDLIAMTIIRSLHRPSVFQPTIWNDDYIQSLHSEYKEETYTEQSQVLREEVRMMICKWTDLCKTYFIEAKLYHSGYTPSFEEYMENAWVSVGAPVMLTHCYFLVPHSFKEEDLVHLEEYFAMIRYSSIIFRLANDLGTFNRENEMGDNSKSIQCYMNENGVSEDDAREHINSMLSLTWKKMNKEAHTSSLPQGFRDAAINAGRTALYMYQHGDGHSVHFPQINNHISSLVFQPINDI